MTKVYFAPTYIKRVVGEAKKIPKDHCWGIAIFMSPKPLSNATSMPTDHMKGVYFHSINHKQKQLEVMMCYFNINWSNKTEIVLFGNIFSSEFGIKRRIVILNRTLFQLQNMVEVL